jgi:hypothetical protein
MGYILFFAIIGLLIYSLIKLRKRRKLQREFLAKKEELILVTFRGMEIPMRREDKLIWDATDYKGKNAHYNQWKDKVKKGLVVKIEGGYVTKEYAELHKLI